MVVEGIPGAVPPQGPQGPQESQKGQDAMVEKVFAMLLSLLTVNDRATSENYIPNLYRMQSWSGSLTSVYNLLHNDPKGLTNQDMNAFGRFFHQLPGLLKEKQTPGYVKKWIHNFMTKHPKVYADLQAVWKKTVEIQKAEDDGNTAKAKELIKQVRSDVGAIQDFMKSDKATYTAFMAATKTDMTAAVALTKVEYAKAMRMVNNILYLTSFTSQQIKRNTTLWESIAANWVK